jgi:hypothetical protein
MPLSQIEDLKIKVVDLAGVKKPALKKVRMSADAMLKALLGSKHTVNMDLRSNLKQVKKEVKEEVRVSSYCQDIPAQTFWSGLRDTFWSGPD